MFTVQSNSSMQSVRQHNNNNQTAHTILFSFVCFKTKCKPFKLNLSLVNHKYKPLKILSCFTFYPTLNLEFDLQKSYITTTVRYLLLFYFE